MAANNSALQLLTTLREIKVALRSRNNPKALKRLNATKSLTIHIPLYTEFTQKLSI